MRVSAASAVLALAMGASGSLLGRSITRAQAPKVMGLTWKSDRDASARTIAAHLTEPNPQVVQGSEYSPKTTWSQSTDLAESMSALRGSPTIAISECDSGELEVHN